MRLHIVSDVHNEFGVLKYAPPEHDIAICAGDICTGVAGIMWAGRTYDPSKTLYVAGNHEFYGKRRLHRHYEKMREKAKEFGVQFLQNDVVVIDGVRFIGCTLWTDFNLHGNQPLAMIQAKQDMNDYRLICIDINKLIQPANVLHEFETSFKFLEETLDIPFDGPTVVITHHAPSEQSCIGRFRGSPANPFYASNLERFILEKQPELWVHGHTHSRADYMIDKTRVVVNPRGYADVGEQTGFDNQLIVEV